MSKIPRLGVQTLVAVARPALRWWARRKPDVVDGQALDADAQWLSMLSEKPFALRLERSSPKKARKQFRRATLLMDPRSPDVASVTERSIPGPDGALRARIYRPSDLETPAPGLLYFHGGGCVIGDLETADCPCRILASEARCVVISVEYRLGPEHPAPAAQDDAVACFRWVAENARELGLDPERIAVGGDSSGGSLSATIAIETRDDENRPCFCLLIYPSTDRASETPSRELFEHGYLQTGALCRWFHEHSLLDVDPLDPRVSPLREPDLSRLPPMWIGTAGYDVLRDEGEAFAERLREAGVSVRLERFESLVHGFIGYMGMIPAARQAMSAISEALAQGIRGAT